MADELAYSSDDLYGQYGYEGGQNVTFSALDAIISNIKVSSAQIENAAITSAHIKEINANIVTITNLTATNIKSLNGLNVGNGNFIVDNNGNVSMKGDLSGSTGNFHQVRISDEFGGDMRIGTGTFNADGSIWTSTGDVSFGTGAYDRAVSIGHVDGGAFDFNIYGSVDAHAMSVYGTPVLYGTHGMVTTTQYDPTRLKATVTHNLPTIHDVQLTIQWNTGSVSLDNVKEVYAENFTSTTFDIQVAGVNFVAGDFINVMWIALPQ
jgi:hypothetical protein